MKEYMGNDFLLQTETAKHLFHDYSENLPIIDYHCHIPPQEIYENRKFENIAQVWLGGHQVKEDGSDYYFGDHYKWRLMRCNGVAEEYITGDRPDRERFQKFAEALEMAIGNPMVHWTQLELKKYFGYTKPLTGKTAQEVWDLCNEKLQNDPKLTVRGLIEQSNVAFIGTTDDPVDSLEWHEKIQADPTIHFMVAPSFRPDKALNIHQDGFVEYMHTLEKVSGVALNSAEDVRKALEKRLDFFVRLGCRASDHGIEYIPQTGACVNCANRVFEKAMAKEAITDAEREDWQSWLMLELGKMYGEKNVVLQIHYNALRNENTKMFNRLGADTGFDGIDSHDNVHGLRDLLNNLTMAGECPKTILYSLNPNDFDMLATMAGCFQVDSPVASRIQLGSAWWFIDTKDGMEKHAHTLARLGAFGDFIGMLTDSRSFLSYTRHEYFRRIMCNVIGNWVENGEFQNDDEILKKIVEGISYYNAEAYFSLKK